MTLIMDRGLLVLFWTLLNYQKLVLTQELPGTATSSCLGFIDNMNEHRVLFIYKPDSSIPNTFVRAFVGGNETVSGCFDTDTTTESGGSIFNFNISATAGSEECGITNDGSNEISFDVILAHSLAVVQSTDFSIAIRCSFNETQVYNTTTNGTIDTVGIPQQGPDPIQQRPDVSMVLVDDQNQPRSQCDVGDSVQLRITLTPEQLTECTVTTVVQYTTFVIFGPPAICETEYGETFTNLRLPSLLQFGAFRDTVQQCSAFQVDVTVKVASSFRSDNGGLQLKMFILLKRPPASSELALIQCAEGFASVNTKVFLDALIQTGGVNIPSFTTSDGVATCPSAQAVESSAVISRNSCTEKIVAIRAINCDVSPSSADSRRLVLLKNRCGHQNAGFPSFPSNESFSSNLVPTTIASPVFPCFTFGNVNTLRFTCVVGFCTSATDPVCTDACNNPPVIPDELGRRRRDTSNTFPNEVSTIVYVGQTTILTNESSTLPSTTTVELTTNELQNEFYLEECSRSPEFLTIVIIIIMLILTSNAISATVGILTRNMHSIKDCKKSCNE